MKKYLQSLLVIAVLSSGLYACQRNTKQKLAAPVLPSEAYDYALNLPASALNNTPQDNPVSNEGATLGRVLFYDRHLSINNQTSCGSCHHQQQAFADPVALSAGFEGKLTSRNSMSIVNAVSATGYFWDNRTANLEEMVLQPVKHSVEMGMEKMEILPMKLAKIDYYPALFEKAFGTPEITTERISKAMAQFLRAMTAYESKADITGMLIGGPFGGWGQTNDPRVSAQEKHGAQLFTEKGCINCHASENLRGWGETDFANIGLEMHYTDKGLGETDPSKEGMFKVPSLRNIGRTAPYMHDGRFKTLHEVLNHYNQAVVDHPNLDTRMKEMPWGPVVNNPPRRLNLSEGDINDLVAFLQTLTDENLISDPKFSDPFRQ